MVFNSLFVKENMPFVCTKCMLVRLNKTNTPQMTYTKFTLHVHGHKFYGEVYLRSILTSVILKMP